MFSFQNHKVVQNAACHMGTVAQENWTQRESQNDADMKYCNKGIQTIQFKSKSYWRPSIDWIDFTWV